MFDSLPLRFPELRRPRFRFAPRDFRKPVLLSLPLNAGQPCQFVLFGLLGLTQQLGLPLDLSLPFEFSQSVQTDRIDNNSFVTSNGAAAMLYKSISTNNSSGE